jgi:hypothetical protein
LKVVGVFRYKAALNPTTYLTNLKPGIVASS